jgi:hypothetical protein
MSQSYRSIYNKFPNAEGWIYQGVIDFMAGAGITIDKTDPAHPIISGSGGSGGGVQQVWAGANITVDNTDPTNPIVSGDGAGDTQFSEGLMGIIPVLSPTDPTLGLFANNIGADNHYYHGGSPVGDLTAMSLVARTEAEMRGNAGLGDTNIQSHNQLCWG